MQEALQQGARVVRRDGAAPIVQHVAPSSRASSMVLAALPASQEAAEPIVEVQGPQVADMETILQERDACG